MSTSPAGAVSEREPPFASSSMILRAIDDGVLLVDRADVVRQANPAAAQLLGLSLAALLGAQVAGLPGGAVLSSQDGEQTGVVEVEGRSLRFRRQPLLADDQDGALVGAMVTLREVTTELAAQRRSYDYVARALHDVRVPLQAMGGAAEGLLRGWFGPLTDEQREFVAMIKENAGRQGDLFGNLFDIYTLSARVAQIQPDQLQLEGLIHEVAHELAARYEARQVSLTLDLQTDMPPVLADRRRVRQVLVALLENACRYTLPAGAVVVRAAERDGVVSVDVQDTGVGIRSVDQPGIFQPFFRGESPLKEGRYGGLNLAIARMLVELQAGRMWFASAEGQGSTFSFTLPVMPQPAGD